MRATDLLGAEVYDLLGVHVGAVHDLRFELTATSDKGFTCRLTGLDCRDSNAIGHRLGYGTGDMAGPWPLSAIFTSQRSRRAIEIDWADVAAIKDRRIELRKSGRELSRPGERR